MEWLTCIRQSINYIEDHLLDDIKIEDIASHVYLSPFLLQRGFRAITGYGIKEYIHNRRLYLASLDLINTKLKVIDISLKYHYENAQSFTKAFSRFHGLTPQQVRKKEVICKSFLPITIHLIVNGGFDMNYKIISMAGFKVIGFQKIFNGETAYQEIPKFWDEIFMKYNLKEKEPTNQYEKIMISNSIGEYGICIDDLCGNQFHYLIAGKYSGGDIPEGMVLYEFPKGEWAVFECYGPCPEALQSLNTKIFTEWLPGNPEFEIDGNSNVEWYDFMGDPKSLNYHTAIWIPVKRIGK